MFGFLSSGAPSLPVPPPLPGIDLILYEREKQQNNFVIYSFYINAVHKVAHLAEKFRETTEAYQAVYGNFDIWGTISAFPSSAPPPHTHRGIC